jgi:3-oxoacyl-[acyl-carrier protein] reductase
MHEASKETARTARSIRPQRRPSAASRDAPRRATGVDLGGSVPDQGAGRTRATASGETNMRLEGKTALITGGASGFGAGIARKFHAEGARVMIADINAEAAEAMAGVLGADWVAGDVGDDTSVQHIAATALGALGPLDILVNNAGITHLPMAMEDVGEDDFDRVLRVNAKSVYLTARHLVPGMKARGQGAILNIASTAGLSPRPRLAWYNASKGWMITATKAMAVELAPAGVRVNALCPVAGETPLLKSFLGEDTPEMRAKFLATIPLGRFSTPADLGHAAVYLCSDEASMLTGVAHEVDGGRGI